MDIEFLMWELHGPCEGPSMESLFVGFASNRGSISCT